MGDLATRRSYGSCSESTSSLSVRRSRQAKLVALCSLHTPAHWIGMCLPTLLVASTAFMFAGPGSCSTLHCRTGIANAISTVALKAGARPSQGCGTAKQKFLASAITYT